MWMWTGGIRNSENRSKTFSIPELKTGGGVGGGGGGGGAGQI